MISGFFQRFWLALVAVVACTAAWPAWAEDFLEPDQAFKLVARVVEPRTVELRFVITPGHYMYRDQFKLDAQGGTLGPVRWPAGKIKFDETFQKDVETLRGVQSVRVPFTAGKDAIRLTVTGQGCADKGLCYPPISRVLVVKLPAFKGNGEIDWPKSSEGFGEFGRAQPAAAGLSAADMRPVLAASAPVSASDALSRTALPVGAAPAAISAPLVMVASSAPAATPDVAVRAVPLPSSAPASAPEPQAAAVPMAGAASGKGETDPAAMTASTASTPAADAGSIEGRLQDALRSGRFWLVIGLFFLGGIGLSFTPCVLPMLPILSSIIVGSGAQQVTRGRGFVLALSYSLGMALVYTALGVAAGLAGEGLAAYFQQPWVLVIFGVLLVLFALSMFGVYELRLPTRLADSLNETSQKLQGGKLATVFGMGAVSALLVSPCVTGVLTSALLYISQTGNVAFGGTALFAMSMGMSVPLLLLGLSSGTLLPRAGPWMDTVKHFFGLLLLGVAVSTVQPLLSKAAEQWLWGALLIALALLLRLFDAHGEHRPRTWLRKVTAGAALVFGLAQWIGAAGGGTSVLHPLGPLLQARAAATAPAASSVLPLGTAKLPFEKIRSVAQLDAILASSRQPVMLDFYADWCKACIEMEQFTFSQAAVQQRLAGVRLLKADVTGNTVQDRELLKRFKLFGPPGIIFFKQGQESGRVVGFEPEAAFLKSLDRSQI